MIEIGDIFRIIASDYLTAGHQYLDSRGILRQGFGPIELYPYTENEYFHVPHYDDAEYKGYIEEGQIVTILDVIEFVSKNTSKLNNKSYIEHNRVDIVFLLNEQRYVYDEPFFLKIARKIKSDD